MVLFLIDSDKYNSIQSACRSQPHTGSGFNKP